MGEKLLPCPFCGGEEIAVHPRDLSQHGSGMPHPGSDAQYLHCDGCGADGPQSFHSGFAIKLWNRRAPSSQTTTLAPKGYALVPIKPTKQMAYKAACHFYGKKPVDRAGGIIGIVMQARDGDPTFWTAFKKIWKAALAHAPRPSEQLPQPNGQCERCQGNGEIVTDWERYRHPREGDVGDEAVAECPNCNGDGEVEASPSPQPSVRVTGFRGNPLRVVLSDGSEATIRQQLIDNFASPSPFGQHPEEQFDPHIPISKSLLEAAIAEIRKWKVEQGGDDQVVLNLEAALTARERSDAAD
jgi:Lar family restriction alleviation protein